MTDADALAALLRTDLRHFIRKCFHTILPGTLYLPNWHIDAIVYQLMRIRDGEINRLLINQPPRSLKSISVSVAYVAWLLGHDPTRRVIVVSYANELAAELHRQFRRIIHAPWCPASTTRRTVPSSLSCSACTKMTSPVICLSKAVGSALIWRRLPRKTASFPCATAK